MRKPKTSKFGIGLLIYAASLTAVMIIAVSVLCAFLASFERNRPDRMAQEYVDTLDEQAVKSLMSKWESGEFETADILYGASIFAEKNELDFRKKADEYTAQKPVYYITAGTVRVGSFSLVPGGDDSFGITKWKAAETELFESEILPDPKEYTVNVPQGAIVEVNGVTVSEKYRTGIGAAYRGSVYFGASDRELYKCDTYALPPLVFPPKIQVKTDSITVTPVEADGKFDAFLCEGLSVNISAPSNASVMIGGTRIPDEFFVKTNEPMALTEFEANSTIKQPTLMHAKVFLPTASGEITATVDGKALDVVAAQDGFAATYRHDSLRSVEISVPDGAQIKINGVTVSEDYFDSESVFSILSGMEKHVGKTPAAKKYRVNGLFAQPEVKVTLDGAEIPLCRSEDRLGVSCLEYYGAPSDSLKKSAQARAVDFVNAYITYTAMGYNGVDEHHAQMMSFVLSGTDTYKLLQKSKESFSWAENYTVTDRTVTTGDFIPLGENSFFCTVDYTANLKKYSYKTVQSGTFRILMVKSGGVFKVGGLLTETK